MTKLDRAKAIWKVIEADLEDRGLFSAVGDDLRPEITSEQINTIMLLLPPE